MRKLIYTERIIKRNGYDFIRVDLDEEVVKYIIYNLEFLETKFKGPEGEKEYEIYCNNELVMFDSIDIGYRDYVRTYGDRFKTFNAAIYIRKDYLYLKDIKLRR